MLHYFCTLYHVDQAAAELVRLYAAGVLGGEIVDDFQAAMRSLDVVHEGLIAAISSETITFFSEMYDLKVSFCSFDVKNQVPDGLGYVFELLG